MEIEPPCAAEEAANSNGCGRRRSVAAGEFEARVRAKEEWGGYGFFVKKRPMARVTDAGEHYMNWAVLKEPGGEETRAPGSSRARLVHLSLYLFRRSVTRARAVMRIAVA